MKLRKDAVGSDDDVENESEDSEAKAASTDSSSSDEIDESSLEEEDEDPEDNSVDVTLEFFDPKEADFQGLKALLQSFLDGAPYNCSELVDTIIKQSTVGTIVKSGDHGDPVGVLSVLNTQRYKELQCLAEIKAFLIQNCSSAELKSRLEKLWEQAGTGLLISERLINCPPQLAPPLHQALFDEVEWAVEDEPTQALQDSFRLGQYITISRVFTDPSTQIGSAGKKQKKQKTENLIVYARPEDEFFHKHCTSSFTFSTGKTAGKDELEPLRLVMLLSSDQVSAARKELDSIVGNVAADGP